MSSNPVSQDKRVLLEQVQAILAGRVSPTRVETARYFAQAFLRRVPSEELSSVAPPQLAAMVGGLMKFAGKREPGSARIRVFNPTERRDGWTCDHTVIEMVNADMPFLVDTANLVMSEQQLGVHLIVHPVIHVQRDRIGRARGFFPTAAGKVSDETLLNS